TRTRAALANCRVGRSSVACATGSKGRLTDDPSRAKRQAQNRPHVPFILVTWEAVWPVPADNLMSGDLEKLPACAGGDEVFRASDNGHADAKQLWERCA